MGRWPDRQIGKLAPLTCRQAEIAGYVAAGFSNPDIAAITGKSLQTVKNHLQNAFDELGIHSRLQMAIWVMEQKMPGVFSNRPPADCRLPPADCRPAHRLEGRA
jgi:DNA-binding NarL/FixJ family response regulator